MKKWLLCLLLGCCMQAFAAPDLIGDWWSDREMTIDFMRDNNRRTDKELAVSAGIMGNLTMTFTADSLKQVMADHKFQVEGKEYDWVGGVSETPYRIVFNGENVVVIVIKEGNDKETALMLNFVDHDTFWLYPGNADSPFPDVHIREYFRRISN